MKVVVIGAGPAGLAAAHAAAGLGAIVKIIAPKKKTPQRGPLLLQRPLPGVTHDHPDGYIKQIVIGGGILDYRYKLYGDVNVNINGDVLQDGYHAWNLSDVYDELWGRYSDLIEDRSVGPKELSALLPEQNDLVVSTAPLNRMCGMPRYHEFRTKSVVITEGASYPGQPDNTIIFNAGDEEPWVRSSRIFGHEVTEWPMGTNIPTGRNAMVIDKPFGSTCNCFPHVLLTGRFGKFRNETWVDTAYYDTRDSIISSVRGHEWNRVT